MLSISRILGTRLRTEAEIQVKQALAETDYGERFKFSWFRGFLNGAGRNPKTFGVCALLLLLASLVVGAMFQNVPWGLPVPGVTNEFFAHLQTINYAILGAQAAFIGLVFPIVIALAESATSGRLGFSGKLKIFLSETEANGTAVTSIGLIMSIIAFGFAAPQLANSIYGLVTLIHTIWAMVNLSAIVRFLNCAIRYFNPAERLKMLRSYLVNTAWPHALTTNFMRKIWASYARKWQGVGEADDLGDFAFYTNSDTKPLILGASFQGEFADAHLDRLDKLYEAIWKRGTLEAVRIGSEPGDQLARGLTVGHFLPFEAINESDKAKFDKAYVLKPSDSFIGAAIVTDLIRDFSAELDDLRKSGRQHDFEEYAQEAADFFAFTLSVAGEFADAPSNTRYTTSHVQEWTRAFFEDVFDSALQAMRESGGYFNSVSYLPYRILLRVPAQTRSVAREQMLFASRRLGTKLIDWIATTSEPMLDGAAERQPLPQSLISRVDRAWQNFISPWEEMLGEGAKECASADTWEQKVALAATPRAQLEDVAILSFVAAFRDEPRSLAWTSDIILKWSSTFSQKFDDSVDLWTGHPAALVWTELVDDWDRLDKRFSVERIGNSGTPEELSDRRQQSVVRRALVNYWSDVRTVSLALQVRLANERASEARCRAINDQLSGTSIDDGWRGRTLSLQLNPADILASCLRIQLSADHEACSYQSHLSAFVERLVGYGERDLVSGRVYSGSGGRGVGTLVPENASLLILSAVASNSVDLKSRNTQQILDHTESRTSRERMQRYLEQLSGQLANTDFEQLLGISTLVNPNASTASLRETSLALQGGVTEIVEMLRALDDADYENAEEDPAALERISAMASAGAAQTPSGQFPISLFESVDAVEVQDGAEFSPFKVNVNNWDFGSISKPRLSAPILGDDTWWANLIEESLSQRLLGDVIAGTDLTDLSADGPDSLWETIREAASQMESDGKTPLLVVPGRAEPRWVSDWGWREERRPEGVNIYRQNEQPTGYVYHINDLAVYHGEIGAGVVYVLPKSAFGRVQLRRFGAHAVQVSFARDPDNIRVGTLTLEYQRHVELLPGGSGARITYPPIDD